MIEVFDIETYPDIFTYTGVDYDTRKIHVFEISERRNDLTYLVDHLSKLQVQVGFNNLAFDYPVLHWFLCNYYRLQPISISDTLSAMMVKVESVISERWSEVKPWEVKIKQIDLFKVHHFDNPAKSTSLKMIQANTWSESVEDLPFEPGKPIGVHNFDKLIKYNIHDVAETIKLFDLSHGKLEFRKDISKRLGKDATNMSDVKIGNEIFITELEEARPGTCFNPDRSKRQTHRESIKLGEVLLPYTDKLSSPELVDVLKFFKETTITDTKGVFKNLTATVNDFDFVFGVGGIHGSIPSESVYSDEEHAVIDWDVV